MTPYRWKSGAKYPYGWLAFAGVGLAAALYTTALRGRRKHREVLAARERARLVPMRQARMEADWTRHAVTYAGGAKGG